MMIPRRTRNPMSGYLASFFLNKKIIMMDTMAKPNVKMLKWEKVDVMISRGLVNGLEFDDLKNA